MVSYILERIEVVVFGDVMENLGNDEPNDEIVEGYVNSLKNVKSDSIYNW